MKILVTGGAGYIGSVVVADLIKLGHQVKVFDDLSTGHEDAIDPAATFINGSMLDKLALASALHNCEAVIHFAAKSLVGESVTNPELYWNTNLIGTKNLLTAMVQADVKKIVFSSTAAVYGDPLSSPITETAQTIPKSPYGESKLAVDDLLSEFCQNENFAAISLRYFNVAGAVGNLGERHSPETHLIPNILSAVLNSEHTFEIYGDNWPTKDGTCVRDYIHVADLSVAHVKALTKLTHGIHHILNLGTETGSSVRDVVAAVEAVTGKKVATQISPPREGDPAILVTSNKLAKEILGWEPVYDLHKIVEDAYEFMKANR